MEVDPRRQPDEQNDEQEDEKNDEQEDELELVLKEFGVSIIEASADRVIWLVVDGELRARRRATGRRHGGPPCGHQES